MPMQVATYRARARSTLKRRRIEKRSPGASRAHTAAHTGSVWPHNTSATRGAAHDRDRLCPKVEGVRRSHDLPRGPTRAPRRLLHRACVRPTQRVSHVLTRPAGAAAHGRGDTLDDERPPAYLRPVLTTDRDAPRRPPARIGDRARFGGGMATVGIMTLCFLL